MKKKNLLRDILYNTDTDCTQSAERPSLRVKSTNQIYAQGILVGAIGTLMAVNGWTPGQTVQIMREYLPADLDQEIIPESWRGVIWEGKSDTYK
jgi:hypothetical protein